MYDQELKEKAIRLRVEERLTIPEVLKQVPVAKSTLSLWLRDYPLSEEELKVRRRINAERGRVSRAEKLGERGPSGSWETRPPLSKSNLGEACRQVIVAKLLLQGLQVFRPLNEDTPIDLVVLTSEGSFLKCQCKCVYRGKGKRAHTMPLCAVRKWGPNSKVAVHKYTQAEVDFFLGYCSDNDSVYIIPRSEVGERSSVSIWVTSNPYAESYQEETLRWCNAYHLLI